MVTISHITRKMIEEMPYVHECMGKNLINYGSVAKMLKPRIDKEMKKDIRLSAIMMALRRYSEEMMRRYETRKPSEIIQDITMKTGICDIVVYRSESIFNKLRKFQEKIDYNRGDIFNIVQGDYEIAIITNNRYKKQLLELLHDEKIIHKEDSLAQLSVRVSKQFYNTPGVILSMTQILNWENINIFEVVSTMTEINFFIHEDDVAKGYGAFMNLMKS